MKQYMQSTLQLQYVILMNIKQMYKLKIFAGYICGMLQSNVFRMLKFNNVHAFAENTQETKNRPKMAMVAPTTFSDRSTIYVKHGKWSTMALIHLFILRIESPI